MTMIFERLPAGQMKIQLSESLASQVVANKHEGMPIWRFAPRYQRRFVTLFQSIYGSGFKYYDAGFYSINLNVLLFFLNINGSYSIQISTENNEADDEFYALSLLESVLKN
jgi:hypothetical protein